VRLDQSFCREIKRQVYQGVLPSSTLLNKVQLREPLRSLTVRISRAEHLEFNIQLEEEIKELQGETTKILTGTDTESLLTNNI
jgi:hypothetical protein